MRRILVATDGSSSAEEAVAIGVEPAGEHGALLDIVHVVPRVDVAPAVGFGSILDDAPQAVGLVHARDYRAPSAVIRVIRT